MQPTKFEFVINLKTAKAPLGASEPARPCQRGDRMSNCDSVAGRSLIDLVTSGLALRAPALGAASALTRPNQSAQWLPSGRRGALTVKEVVGPNDVIDGPWH
jgi:hypothetical protein